MSAASGFYSNFTNPVSRLLFEGDGFVLLSVPSGTDKCSNGGGTDGSSNTPGGGENACNVGIKFRYILMICQIVSAPK